MSDEEHDDGYKVSAKVDMKTLMAQDAEDESLRKYKESLLGKLDESVCPKDDPRRVVIKEMKVICDGRPKGDITFTLDTQASLDAMKHAPFTLKEGCQYKIKVSFKVQHEIVSGLKYVNQVYRKGIRVLREEEMLGSFPPQTKFHEVTFPRHGWDEAPSGMLSRGTYIAKSTFTDDDKQKHLEYEYSFHIKKDWE